MLLFRPGDKVPNDEKIAHIPFERMIFSSYASRSLTTSRLAPRVLDFEKLRGSIPLFDTPLRRGRQKFLRLLNPPLTELFSLDEENER
jgi:hypothetical protein